MLRGWEIVWQARPQDTLRTGPKARDGAAFARRACRFDSAAPHPAGLRCRAVYLPAVGSLHQLLGHRFIQGRVGHQFFELAVFLFDSLEAFDRVLSGPAVLLLPAVIGGRTDRQSRRAATKLWREEDGSIDAKVLRRLVAERTPGLDIRWWHGKPDLSETPLAHKPAAQVKAQIQQFAPAYIVAEIHRWAA